MWLPEYGDPAKPDEYTVLRAYSPYAHIKDGTRYPALLVTTADQDGRVDPVHARKFVARVRAASSSGAPVLMRVERNSERDGGDLVARNVDANVDQLLFLVHALGMNATPAPR